MEINQTEAAQVLRRATQAPDARVRLLSSLVMRHQFPVGTSTMAISQSVASAKNGSVKPEVVIVSGDEVQSGDMRFILEQAGYAAQTAETGPAGIDLAFAQMNCELFIVHAEATRWPLATTLANLRSDVRTRNTPVVVIGPSTRTNGRGIEQTASGSLVHPGTCGKQVLIGQAGNAEYASQCAKSRRSNSDQNPAGLTENRRLSADCRMSRMQNKPLLVLALQKAVAH